jgi:alpha-galactosidase
MSRAAIDQYKLLGLMPIGDTPRQGGWQYHLDLETKQKWYGWLGGFDSEIGWQRYLDRLSARVDHIFRVAVDPAVSLTEEFPPVSTREQQVPIIDALVNNAPPPKEICPQGLFQVNVPNNGAIEGIADDVVVEVPAVVSKRGVQPVHVGKLPQKLMLHVLLPRILEMERNLWAHLSGDRNMLMSILLWDHRTRTPEQAEAVLEDLLALPFNKEMAEHYK